MEDSLVIESKEPASEHQVKRMVQLILSHCPRCNRLQKALIDIQNILGWWYRPIESWEFERVTLTPTEAKELYRILNSVLSEYSIDESDE